MKDSIGFILVLLALHPSVAQKIQNLDDFPELEKVIQSAVTNLEHREREDRSILVFKHGGENPFTGWFKQVRETGKLRSLEEYKNGKLHGRATRWYSNGQKKDESLYQNGRVISIVVWKPNGEKCSDTKLINGNGVWVRYDENGTESWRSNYRNGQYLLN